MPIPRWRASPLYYVSFRKPDGVERLRLPLKVTFERQQAARPGEEERAMEDFRIREVIDADEQRCVGTVDVRLQTMLIENQAEAGYWLDTGVLQVRIGPIAGGRA